MGIYISGVKGLPEQVQKNKEDIKTIQDEIEGIDFEQIRELEEQVAENTGDINNLENAIGVQNQAINTLNDDVDALETKTQAMSYSDYYGYTEFTDSIKATDDVYASNVRVMGDGSIVNASQSGMHFKEGANDDTLTIANNDGATPHYLHFNADGTLDIDGQPVGGATLYQHNIALTIVGLSVTNVVVITNDDTPFTTDTFRQYLITNGLGSTAANGLNLYNLGYASSKMYSYRTIYYYGNNIKVDTYDYSTSSTAQQTGTVSNDKVVPITQ